MAEKTDWEKIPKEIRENMDALVAVLLIGLAVVGVLGLLAFRVARKAHRIAGWLRWAKPRKNS